MIDFNIHKDILRIEDLQLESNLSSLTSRDMGTIEEARSLIAPRSKKTFKTSRKDFLETIVSEGVKPGGIYWKNWLKIAAILTQPGRKFFSLQDLNDTEYFRVLYHEADAEWGGCLERFISQELQTSPILQN